MMKYSMVCDMGHEPQTMTVEAATEEEAMAKMMEQCKAHLAQVHSDNPMTDDQVMEMIKTKWTKSA